MGIGRPRPIITLFRQKKVQTQQQKCPCWYLRRMLMRKVPYLLLFTFVNITCLIHDRCCVLAEGADASAPTTDGRQEYHNNHNQNLSRPIQQHQCHNQDNYEDSSSTLTVSSSSDNADSIDDDDDNNIGIVQVIESEIWDASTNTWRGANDNDGLLGPGHTNSRWINERGLPSPSPSEVQPPKGYQFLGDWKIVVISSGGGGGDPMGWEYQFQYLQPPKRRRIWLRSLQPIKKPVSASSTITTQASRQQSSKRTAKTTTRQKQPFRAFPLTTSSIILQRIRDDWNFKGLGMSLYKSVICPASCGIALQLPLTVNFDVFDRHPELPSVSSSVQLYFPWTIVALLSTSVHVEWVKWIFQSALGLLPRIFVWVVYRLILPIVWTVTSILLFPIKDKLPALPKQIPEGFWTVAKPQYNPEISERLGCSVSYRWSQDGGYEFRISYWYSYLPTFLVYQRFLSQTQQQLQSLKMRTKTTSSTTKISKKLKDFSPPPSAFSSSSSPSSTTTTNSTSSAGPSSSSTTLSLTSTAKKTSMDWWQKHFARLGVSTGYPIPSPPNFSCSAVLTLSGLFLSAAQQNIGGGTSGGGTSSPTVPVDTFSNVTSTRYHRRNETANIFDNNDTMVEYQTKEPSLSSRSVARNVKVEPLRSNL